MRDRVFWGHVLWAHILRQHVPVEGEELRRAVAIGPRFEPLRAPRDPG